VHGEDVSDEFDPVDYDCGEQEGQNGERTHADEKDVDGAGDALAAAAVAALGEMLFVVSPHGRGQAGDIVTPSREDVSYHLVGAGAVVRPAVRRKC
jgi:hypothetical protein